MLGGCGWYRCGLPSKQLNANGITSVVGLPAFSDTGFGAHVSDKEAYFGFDVVVLKLIMSERVIDDIFRAKALGQVIVADVDDFYPALQADNQAFHATDPQRDKTNNREHYYRTLDLADHLTVATQGLYDYYSRRHPSVTLIRNGIDLERWKLKKVKDRTPILGWVGATPWRSHDLEIMQTWLPKFQFDYKVHIHHSGHVDYHHSFTDLTRTNPKMVTTTKMLPIVDYPKMFMPIDIGIVPLNNVEFNTVGKSALKGMEYAASGIPFVASATPEYRLLESQGIGRVAYNDDDWVRHLTELLDYQTRKRDAKRNYQNLIKAHTMQLRGKEWARFIRGL